MTSEQQQHGLITKVERQTRSKDRYNLYVDDQFAFSLHEDVLIKYRLIKGARISTAEMRQIAQAQERQQAYLDAVRLLSIRLRSEHELAFRLKQKGYDAAIVEASLERLRAEQYVNDTLFAEQLTHQRIGSQRKGRQWVKQELLHKGLKPEQINHALDQVDVEVEFRSAFDLASKKYRSEGDADQLKLKRKTIALLQRRGYSSDIISRVMRQLGDSVDEAGAAGFDDYLN
ncbi:recombinase RecX [Paenibacillus xerothermodurans]|uniref:Regulatory protein RecX n=2 Tax=Paenibacillus xerothermodurans TaxID=1977292 RepID=A0A2W1NDT2_PAEXE|nr:recombinase RecX [Paenibacillus xerothermodurans]